MPPCSLTPEKVQSFFKRILQKNQDLVLPFSTKKHFTHVEYCNSVASSDHRKYLFIYLITSYLYFSWDNCFPGMSPTNINTFTGHACQSLLTSCDAVSAPLYFGEMKPSHALECRGSWELASFPPGIHQTHGHTQSHSCIPPSEDCCFARGCEKLETTKGLCMQSCYIPHLQPPFPFPSFHSLTLQIHFMSLCQVPSWYKNMV